MDAGFVYIWSYDVREGRELEFEKLYGSDGDWARFFGKSGEYLGTELLRDPARKGCYLTIDRWRSEAAYRAFVAEHRQEFSSLDREGDALTTKETRLGEFHVVKGT
jgi:heme-degrading monooxygenase HmoA